MRVLLSSSDRSLAVLGRAAQLALLSGALSCSSASTCTTSSIFVIKVVDAETDADLCNATVTVTAPSGATVTLAATASMMPCHYETPVGAGRYQVAASVPTYQSQLPYATNIPTIQCSVEAPDGLTFTMTPIR